MRDRDENVGLEFHDSTLVEVERGGTEVTLVLDAYVHRSKGIPGVSPGSGWWQGARLRLGDASVETEFSSYPALLSDGRFVLPGRVIDNVVPVSVSLVGPLSLELVDNRGALMVIQASAAEVVLTGEATRGDDFPG